MKLRQKLAVILSLAMALTAMPAMAASTNTVSRVPAVGKDSLVNFSTATKALTVAEAVDYPGKTAGDVVTYVNGGAAPTVNIEYNDATLLKNAVDSFIIKVTDGEFENVLEYAGKVNDIVGENLIAGEARMKLTRQSSTILLVEVAHGTGSFADGTGKLGSLKSYKVPLYVKAKGAAPAIEIMGENSLVTSSAKVVIASASTTDKKGDITFGDVEKFYDKGTLGKITVLETYPGAFANESDPAKRKIKITLEHDDFGYDLQNGAVIGKYTRGATGSIIIGTNATIGTGIDSQILWVDAPAVVGQTVRAAVEIDGIKVSARKPELGAFEVTVGGDLVEETTAKLAEVVEFGVKLSMKDDKAKTIKAGRDDKITFSFEEIIEDSMAVNRSVEFKLKNAHFFKGVSEVKNSAGATLTVAQFKALPAGATYEMVEASSKTKVNEALTLEIFKDAYIKKIAVNDRSDLDLDHAITALIYDGKKVVGFEFTPNRSTGTVLLGDKKDKFTFEDVKVAIELGDREKETAQLTVSGPRMFGDDLTIDAVNIVNPVKVEFVGLTAKVGLKNQSFPDAKVIITETEKGVFKKGQVLKFAIADNDQDIQFSADPVVTVKEGNVKLVDKDDFTINKVDGSIEITIKRESKTPATIEVSGIKLNLDRTVPQGNYDLKISGKAIADYGDIALKDFVKVGTPNTEDIATNGLRKGNSSFVIGSAKYLVNGIEKEMDAAPYIEGASTMLPIRYVSEALGVSAQDILFSAGKVTIVAGNRTIQLANGSNVAVLNGANVTMAQKALIKDGRTYVPVGEVARLLGVKVEWNNDTKTATFINE